jgi:hypothetical protein
MEKDDVDAVVARIAIAQIENHVRKSSLVRTSQVLEDFLHQELTDKRVFIELEDALRGFDNVRNVPTVTEGFQDFVETPQPPRLYEQGSVGRIETEYRQYVTNRDEKVDVGLVAFVQDGHQVNKAELDKPFLVDFDIAVDQLQQHEFQTQNQLGLLLVEQALVLGVYKILLVVVVYGREAPFGLVLEQQQRVDLRVELFQVELGLGVELPVVFGVIQNVYLF